MRILSPNVRRTLELAPLDASPNALRAKGPMDPALAATVVGLIGFGVVMVYSASAATATNEQHDAQFFLKRQAAYAVASLLVLFGVSRVDYHRLYKLTYPVLAGVALLLVACVVGFGHTGGGATRWLSIGPVHVQPASSGSRIRSPRRPSASRRSRSGSCHTCSWPACSWSSA
jgi:cell division protein FtsW (lipid II flippase)